MSRLDSYSTSADQRPGRATRPAWNRGSFAWLMAGLVVLVGLFVAGLAAQNFGRVDEPAAASTPDAKATTPPAKAPKAPGLGDPVRDGKFEFIVTRLDCGKPTIGNKYLKTTAKGQFCVVSLSARNVGDQQRIFSGRAQKAYNAAGTEFSNDAVADFYANDNSQTFLKRISPGDKVTGKVVFDIPRSTKLTSLELHDSFLSDGVRVTLSKRAK
jgi:hypothetical protein